jgi:hypothetical protein
MLRKLDQATLVDPSTAPTQSHGAAEAPMTRHTFVKPQRQGTVSFRNSEHGTAGNAGSYLAGRYP